MVTSYQSLPIIFVAVFFLKRSIYNRSGRYRRTGGAPIQSGFRFFRFHHALSLDFSSLILLPAWRYVVGFLLSFLVFNQPVWSLDGEVLPQETKELTSGSNLSENCLQSTVHWPKTFTLKPDSWEHHLLLGKALAQSGKEDEALLEFFQSLRLNQKNPEARSEVGTILFRRGNWDEAGGQFKQVLDLKPNDLKARGNLAICLEQLGLIDHAIQQFRLIIQCDPDNLRGLYNLAAALERKRQFEQAAGFYKKTIDLAQRKNSSEEQAILALSLSALGRCMIQLNDPKSAITLAQESIQLAPDNHFAYLALGDAFTTLGAAEEAINAYKKAIQLNPKDPLCRRALSRLLKKDIANISTTSK